MRSTASAGASDPYRAEMHRSTDKGRKPASHFQVGAENRSIATRWFGKGKEDSPLRVARSPSYGAGESRARERRGR